MRYKRLFQIFNGLFFFAVLVHAQINSDTSCLHIVFAGDVMGHDSQINSAFNDSTRLYDYKGCFKYMKPFIDSSDIAIVNLEVTLAGPPYKGYPQFSSPDNLALALKQAGFDIFITANNHSLDRGSKGMERTINMLDSLNIIHTGTFKDSVSREITYPLIFEKNNIKVALLNYTYGTNGLKVKYPNIINYIDTNLIKIDLEKARSVHPDFIIVTMHWGIEYNRTESVRQRKLADIILSNGADAIIGMHPHVVQPIKKVYNDTIDSTNFKIIVYSLGNYISNQRNRYTDGGIMFSMTIEKYNYYSRIKDYNYLPTWVYKPKINEKTLFTIVPANSFKNDFSDINLSSNDSTQMRTFYEDTKSLLNNIQENYFFINAAVDSAQMQLNDSSMYNTVIK